jgi:hypothetical protein
LQGRFKLLRDTKVTNFHVALLGQKDVLRFEVPVHDFTVVNVLHSKTDLTKPVENLRFRDGLFFDALV